MIGLEEAIIEGGRRLEVAWPARRWTAELRAEYRDALRAIGDPEAIRDGVRAAVRGWGGDFPPPIASLCEIVWEAQRKRLEAERERQAEERRSRDLDFDPAPAWWARLIMGALIHSMQSRGIEVAVPPRTLPYLTICEEHGVTPYDIGGELDGSDSAAHARPAIEAAREYGEGAGDDRAADGRELAGLVRSVSR